MGITEKGQIERKYCWKITMIAELKRCVKGKSMYKLGESINKNDTEQGDLILIFNVCT